MLCSNAAFAGDQTVETAIRAELPPDHATWLGGEQFQVTYHVELLGVVQDFVPRRGSWSDLSDSAKRCG